jgi:hypothetical protein
MRNVYMKVMREKRSFITREMVGGKIVEHPEVVENFEALIRVTLERAMGSSRSAHEAAAMLIQLGMGKPTQPIVIDEVPLNDALRNMSDKELDVYTYRILGVEDGVEVCARERAGTGEIGNREKVPLLFPRIGREESIAGEALSGGIVESPVVEKPKEESEEENELL